MVNRFWIQSSCTWGTCIQLWGCLRNESAYRRAVSNMENIYGKNCVFLTTPILGMAKVLSSIGRTSKAVEFYSSATTLLESSRGAESEDLVIPLSASAILSKSKEAGPKPKKIGWHPKKNPTTLKNRSAQSPS